MILMRKVEKVYRNKSVPQLNDKLTTKISEKEFLFINDKNIYYSLYTPTEDEKWDYVNHPIRHQELIDKSINRQEELIKKICEDFNRPN